MNGSSAATADQVFDVLAPRSAPPAISALYHARRSLLDLTGFSAGVVSTLTPYAFESLHLRTPITDIPQSAVEGSVVAQQDSRVTTAAEHAIGEFRRWTELSADWDGEGASAPIPRSLSEASAFACLISDDSEIEPMLHATGRAGLYFRTAALYADIEFLGDGRAAYYVERNGDKHKGVVNFDKKEMPAVFEALLKV